SLRSKISPMKYPYFIAVCIVLIICSCAPEHEMKLTGTIEGLKKGTLILQKIEDTTLLSIDSIQIDGDPNFEFSIGVPSPEFYYLFLRLKDGYLLDERSHFFSEEGEMQINTTLKNFGSDYTVSGSTNHEKLEEYKQLISRYADKNLEVVSLRLKAMAEQNDSMYQVLTEQEERLLRSKYLASVNYALSQKEYEIAPYIMVNEVQGVSRKYLDTVYQSLPQNIKSSKYGTDLELLLNKLAENEL
ncbi:MAG: DUF4369 domain-containing protein, partial [Marinirhabdus sp.]|nr:DUF4369 domain-containing protein [Marinirhabdus sp.]